jgi:formyltetrahydrofolate deformylase
MQAVITAVGPDHRGLADPIVHSVTELGANIAEIQMYDRDDAHVFSMLTRIVLEPARYADLRDAMVEVSKATGLSIRTWSPDLPQLENRKPRLAICVTYRPETPLAVLRAIRDGRIRGEATVVISNRSKLQAWPSSSACRSG